jgi:hypothetical protein
MKAEIDEFNQLKITAENDKEAEYLKHFNNGVEITSLTSTEHNIHHTRNIQELTIKPINIRICKNCGWEGKESECIFGHNDFICPKCGKESLMEVK